MLPGVKYGVWIAQTAEGILPAEIAQLAEGLGFELLWVLDHTHIPVDSTLFPAEFPEGDVMPPEYSQVMDPMIALAVAAAVTSRIKLGTAILLVTQRDPIVTAKAVASLDQVSNGRILFGIGAGWNEVEMLNHGTDPRRRISVMRERTLAMKEIWTKEVATYAGEFVKFDRIKSWPKPVQKPHPPILIGGNGKKAEDRVLEYGDEWMPENAPDIIERVTAFLALRVTPGAPTSPFRCSPQRWTTSPRTRRRESIAASSGRPRTMLTPPEPQCTILPTVSA